MPGIELTNIIVALANKSDDRGKVQAFVNIEINKCFMVRGLKVIKGNQGLFVAMPNRKNAKGDFRDVAHPVNAETRKLIEDAILKAYNDVCKDQGVPEDE